MDVYLIAQVTQPSSGAWSPEGWVLIITAIGGVLAIIINNRKQNKTLGEIAINVDGNLTRMRFELAQAMVHISSLTGTEADKALADKAVAEAAIKTVHADPPAVSDQPVAINVVGEATIGKKL